MEVSKLISSFGLKLSLVILLMTLILIGGFYELQISACRVANQNLTLNNQNLQSEIEQLDSQKSYQNTQYYLDKLTREKGYKEKDEEVFDLSAVENLPADPEYSFIPSGVEQEKEAIFKWIDTFSRKQALRSDTDFSC